MKKHKNSNFLWTKKGLTTVIDLWDTHTKEELAEKLGCNPNNINYIVGQLRKSGFKLSRKRQIGYVRSLIEELKREL